MRTFFSLVAIILFAICVQAKERVTKDAAILETAKETLKAHGGEKLSNIKTLILRGTADVNAGSTFTLPAGFAIVTAGEKYRLDIQASGMFSFLQISDGVNTSSSMPGITLPPINRVGLFILPRIQETGYVLSALPEKLKKKKGFRLTSPDGYFTDFVVDEKTFRVKEFESTYEFDGRMVATAVSIEKYREIDGVLINEKFSQRLDLGQITAYANYNAKDILVNTEVADDVFTIK